MAIAHGQRSARLALERLEGREVPATTPWSLETFEQTAPGLLPTGWQEHATPGATGFQATQNQALGSQTALATSGSSAAEIRTWLNTALPADAQVSVNVYLDSLIPAQLIARGQNLDTEAPSFYAAAITRGVQLQLFRVVNGQSTVLASLQSANWLSNQWVRVSLTTVGNTLKVQVFRTDTGQYLGANGRWQLSPTDALTAQDGALTGGGYAGLGRAALYSGTVHFDNFNVAPPPIDAGTEILLEEPFGRPVPGGLPAGWAQWNGGSSHFQISPARTLSGNGGLILVNAGAEAARSWYDAALPSDADISAAVYLNNASPAQILARGQNLSSNAPSYYAVNVTRGLELQLIRIVDGQKTVLGTLDSRQWVSGQWIHVTFSLQGDDLRVMAYRHDTGQYLAADGTWQVAPAWAMEVQDDGLTAGGRAGVGKAAGAYGSVTFDSLTVTRSTASAAAPDTTGQDPFEHDTAGQAPAGWDQWSNAPSPSFQVSDEAALSGANSLATTGASDTEARAWLNTPLGPDVQVGAAVYLDSLVPARMIVRGQDLDTIAPSYYAVSIARGVDLQLIRVVNGQATTLSSLSSNTWDSNLWARLELTVQGDNLQVQVIRTDTNQYLNQNGDWQSDPAVAMSVTDEGLPQGGAVGLARPASYSGRLLFDDFSVVALAAPPPTTPPPVAGDTPDSPPVTPPPPDSPPVTSPPPSTGGGIPTTPPVTTPPTNPPPTIPPATTPPPVSAPSDLPAVARHYSHIRVAQLAYFGTPMGAFEQDLLRNSVDLVVPNTNFLNRIDAVSPNTPLMIYSNASNVYQELLTDWLNWADRNGVSREAAFYHVKQAQPFTGDSASSYPVAWFWNVQVGADGAWSDQTTPAHDGDQQVAFGGAGQVVALGNLEPFREINVNLAQGGANGWTGVLEYATAVDVDGNPTAWKTLQTISDGTNGFRQSGRITFDPPSDWMTASIGDTERLYFARVRTVTNGTAPIANNITGRDYVSAAGLARGTVPAFDRTADLDGDGYLNDAEYARRRNGMDARFIYESRAFYPAYGQNRFATNVANPDYQRWVADYSYRFLQAHPQANGLFLDNSLSKISYDPTTIQESLANYADNYAELLAGINRKIAPKWVLANVAGGGVAVDALAKRGISYLEEFAIRPMAASYSQFEDVASNLKRRLSLSNGKSYAILDSLATGDEMLDPRMQIGTLAYYYLLADPHQTFLMFNGGNEPSSTWARHWTDAVEFNVGQPVGDWSVFAQGKDPTNSTMTYKVYERQYTNALIMYKPLSYYRGKAGTTADGTATVHNLGGTYRPLNADGTLGAPITRITLRNGEGAILVKA